MSSDAPTLRQVAWNDLFGWLLLFRTFRLAVRPQKLVLCALALVLVAAGWWSIGQVFRLVAEGNAPLEATVARYDGWPWDAEHPGAYPRELRWSGYVEPAEGTLAARSVGWLSHNPTFEAWQHISRPFRELFSARQPLAPFTFVLLCGLWAVAVWSFFGGAVTRLAAVELARDDRCSMSEAAGHAWSKWESYFWAPLFPLIGVVLIVLAMILPALLLRYDVGLVLAGVLWAIVLVAGAALTALLVGLAAGFPLMWATISTEGTDAFDGISRSYGYLVQRPLHYLFYGALATAFGMLCWLFVATSAAGTVYLSAWAASWGTGSERMADIMADVPAEVVMVDWPVEATAASEVADTGGGQASTTWTIGVFLVGCWLAVVKMLAVAFLFSYFWTAATAIYLLLRQSADGTETDEIYLPEEEEQYGLPPLDTDEAGVPLVSRTEEANEADEPPADEEQEAAGTRAGGDAAG